MNIPTWQEMIASIVADENRKRNYFIPSSLFEQCNINQGDCSYEKEEEAVINQKRFYFIPYVEWLCTDTMVGLYVYFLDDVPICASWQNARKNDKNYFFFGQEQYNNLRSFLISFLEDEYKWIRFVDVTEKMPEFR